MAPRLPGVYPEDKHEIGEGVESESNSEASDASGQDEPKSVRALLQNPSSSTPAQLQYAMDMNSAVEVGITWFRGLTDDDKTALAMYNEIKKEARPESKQKTTLTPWIGTIRKQMKAIHV